MPSPTIAQTILQQLGGVGRLKVMTGAKEFAHNPKGVQFKINGRHPEHGQVTHIRITLTNQDLYCVEYIRVRAGNVKVLCKSEDIYCDRLQDDFEQNTQLYLSL